MFSAIAAGLRPRSLRARLILWYLLMLGGALLALAALALVFQARSLGKELDAELQVAAHGFATDHSAALLSLDPARSLEREPQAESVPFVLRQASGAAVFRSPSFPELDWAGERLSAAAARGRPPLFTVSDRDGHSFRIATHLVRRPGAEALAVQVGAPTTAMRRALGRFALGIAGFIVLVLAAAGWGGSFIATRALAPVAEIVRRVRDVQAAQPQARLEMDAGSAELDRLVVTLNEMLDRIGASVQAARRFAVGASHELQSPLATMRGAIELCLRERQAAPDHRELATELLAEIGRLSKLIRDLRLLALADAGQLVAERRPVDLAALAKECSEIAQALAEEKRIRVEFVARGRPVVLGSPDHLRRVMLNLLENALRYSPPSSTLEVVSARAKGQGMFAVLDHGCGIEASDLTHIFEPFYRADPARAHESGGTGLGLTIADELVRLHGGQMRVASSAGRGSTFVVYVPLADPADVPSGDRPAVCAAAFSPSAEIKAS